MQRLLYLILITVFFVGTEKLAADTALLGGTNVGLRDGSYIDPSNGAGDKSEEQLIDLCNDTNGNFELINRDNENDFYEVTFDAGLPTETTLEGQYGRLVYYTCNNGSYNRYFEFINNPPIYRPDPLVIDCNKIVEFEPFDDPNFVNGGFIKNNLSIEIKEKQIDNCTTEHSRSIKYIDSREDNEYVVFIIEETIIQTDDTAPTFTQVPATATIKCTDYPTEDLASQVIAEDDCSTVNISFTDDRQPDCSKTTTITRTWTATDACGQSTTAQTVITVLPEEEPPTSACEAVKLFNISLINQLVIDNVLAPNAILTVFKVSDFGHLRLVWSCSADCFPQNLLTLETGNYRVNIRLYDENWRSICETDKEIFIGEDGGNGNGGGNNGGGNNNGNGGNNGGGNNGGNSGNGGNNGGNTDDGTTTETCDGVKITTTNKYISITGFGGDGIETKVFDANWNRVFSCEIGECADPIQIDNLHSGKHFIIFKRYKVGEFGSLALVCDELVEVTVGSSGIAPLVAAETEKQLPKLKDFQISPNPANDYLYLGLRKYRGEAVNIQVYDQLGNPVLERQITEVKDDLEYISLHNFDNGVYFIKIHNPRYRAVTQRVVVARMY